MIHILDGSSGDVLGVEITGGYTKEDVEVFRKAFEDVLAQGHERVNILCKIDQLKFTESEFMAFVSDGKYSLKNMDKMRHLAIVADSGIMEVLIKLDNAILGRPKEELIEKYFAVDDMEAAWAFVRS